MKKYVLVSILAFGLFGCSTHPVLPSEQTSFKESDFRKPASVKTTFMCVAQKINNAVFRYSQYELVIDEQGSAHLSAKDATSGFGILGTGVTSVSDSNTNASFQSKDGKTKMLAMTLNGKQGLGKIETEREIIPLDCQSQQYNNSGY